MHTLETIKNKILELTNNDSIVWSRTTGRETIIYEGSCKIETTTDSWFINIALNYYTPSPTYEFMVGKSINSMGLNRFQIDVDIWNLLVKAIDSKIAKRYEDAKSRVIDNAAKLLGL